MAPWQDLPSIYAARIAASASRPSCSLLSARIAGSSIAASQVRRSAVFAAALSRPFRSESRSIASRWARCALTLAGGAAKSRLLERRRVCISPLLSDWAMGWARRSCAAFRCAQPMAQSFLRKRKDSICVLDRLRLMVRQAVWCAAPPINLEMKFALVVVQSFPKALSQAVHPALRPLPVLLGHLSRLRLLALRRDRPNKAWRGPDVRPGSRCDSGAGREVGNSSPVFATKSGCLTCAGV